ncbi:hypothetical protein V1478_004313 [Vespula squamosa]|uniref:Uncharacterized protein n=1 Tax=Vespula squamosa TaxID=30214 RepID=A0ABD2BHD8_VESSQ
MNKLKVRKIYSRKLKVIFAADDEEKSLNLNVHRGQKSRRFLESESESDQNIVVALAGTVWYNPNNPIIGRPSHFQKIHQKVYGSTSVASSRN